MTAGQRHAMIECLISLAGYAGARRAFQGSAPGWRRERTPRQITAHHEAAHAIVSALLGMGVAHLDVLERLDLHRIGVCVRTHLPGEDVPMERLAERLDVRSELDYRSASKWCYLMAPSHDWRGALGVARELRRRTRGLVDAHWYRVTALAAELERRGTMSASEIAPFLPPPMIAAPSLAKSEELAEQNEPPVHEPELSAKEVLDLPVR